MASGMSAEAVTERLGSRSPDAAGSPSAHAGPASFTQIEVSDDFCVGIAYELNRNAEGIDLVQPPLASISVVVKPDFLEGTAAEPVADTSAERLEFDFTEFLCGMPDDESGDRPVVMSDPPRDTAESAIDESLDARELYGEFGAELTDDAEPLRAKPLTTDTAHAIPWPTFAPAETTVPVTNRVARETTVPWPVFAPDERPDASGIAEMIAPSPEGVRSAATVASNAQVSPGWHDAADLTRQAMRAWMNVLLGPKSVQVTVR
jgi:hypothetical protein